MLFVDVSTVFHRERLRHLRGRHASISLARQEAHIRPLSAMTEAPW